MASLGVDIYPSCQQQKLEPSCPRGNHKRRLCKFTPAWGEVWEYKSYKLSVKPNEYKNSRVIREPAFDFHARFLLVIFERWSISDAQTHFHLAT